MSLHFTLQLCLYLTLLCALPGAYAQSGIGTDDPQESLHVGGSSSRLRIDGLNSSNHTNNLGGTDLYNIMVDSEGRMALGLQSGQLYSNPKLGSTVAVATTATAGLNATELYQHTFTLSQRALVVITYNIGLAFTDFAGTGDIADGRAKIAHNYFYLGNGTAADYSQSYGMTSAVYSNYIDDAASNQLFNSQTQILTLPAGTHSIHMYGASYGGGITASAAFQTIFGGDDRLDISVIYL